MFHKEVNSVLKKTAKIAGVTCIAAGAVAVMTSGIALKTITEGGKYLFNSVKKIVNENEEAENIVEAAEVDAATEEATGENN